MKKLLFPASLVLVLVLVLLLFAGLAVAQKQSNPAVGTAEDSVHFGWADVLRVDPVHESGRGPNKHEECVKQPVQRSEHSSNSVGGAVGNGVVRRNGESYVATETHCAPATEDNARDPQHVVAYDVEYRYRGEIYMARLSYDPGDRLRVRVSVLPAE